MNKKLQHDSFVWKSIEEVRPVNDSIVDMTDVMLLSLLRFNLLFLPIIMMIQT